MAECVESLDNDKFSVWLTDKLKELNFDDSIIESYIIGILGSEESEEDKREALDGVLSELGPQTKSTIDIILQTWHEQTLQSPAVDEEPAIKSSNIDEQLEKLFVDSKILRTKPEHQASEEAKLLKEQILQHENVSESLSGSTSESDVASVSGLEKNTNAQNVIKQQKEKREQARAASAAKKHKDKEDRERQRQMRQEKREKKKETKTKKKDKS